MSLRLTVPYCLKSLEHLSQAGRLSLSDEFLRVWGITVNSSLNHNKTYPPTPQKTSISHHIQKHLLDWVEFQATIGASNKGVLLATLLWGERRRREKEGERENSCMRNLNTITTSYGSLIGTYLTQLLAGWEIFKLAASVAVGTGKEHVSGGLGGRRALGGHLEVSQRPGERQKA